MGMYTQFYARFVPFFEITIVLNMPSFNAVS